MTQSPTLKAIFFFFCLAVLSFVIGSAQAESPFPKLKGLVNDFANVIAPSHENKIFVLTQELPQNTEVPVVVGTMPISAAPNVTTR